MRQIILIAHDIRSSHNVGSLLRTAEGLGVGHVYLSGYTPYPEVEKDSRLPHLARKVSGQIHKTALGAESLIKWSHTEDLGSLLADLRSQNFTIYGLEQTGDSMLLPGFNPPEKIAILLGNEVKGLDGETLELCDGTLEIPMLGKKESFNVVQAAAMALYHCRHFNAT